MSRSRKATASLTASALVAGLLGAAGALSVPTAAQAADIPIIGCTSDTAVFNTAYDVNTGEQMAPGTRDQRWQVGTGTATGGPASVPSWEDAYVPATILPAWSASPFDNAGWVTYNDDTLHNGSIDLYFRIQFNVTDNVSLENFVLPMDFYADNSVPEVWVNGDPQSDTQPGLPQAPAGQTYVHNGFQPGTQASTELSGFQHGLNEIVVRVASNGPAVGFMAQIQPSGVCADFGDAEGYGTTLDEDGARHGVPGYDEAANTAPLMLGQSIDVEADGQSTADASGDDANGIADEDGIASPIVMNPGLPTNVTVSATNNTDGPATLVGWMDLNGDGTFDASERVSAPVPAGSGSADYALVFPGSSTQTDSFARFRLFSGDVADASPAGYAAAGEVEDYAVSVEYLEQPPFSCTSNAPGLLYQSIPGSVSTVDLVTGEYETQENIFPRNINAVGFNALDGYVYGYTTTTEPYEMVRVGQDGSVQPLGQVPGIDTTFHVGDVDADGHYWVANATEWYEIDLAPGSPTYRTVLDSGTLSYPAGTPGLADWAAVPGGGDYLYGVSSPAGGDAVLLGFNRETQAIESFGSLGVPISAVGAVYADGDGFLYSSSNADGRIFRIDVQDETATLFAQGPASGQNDGARCALSPILLDFGDAPDSYDTTLASGGPRHGIQGLADGGSTTPLMLGGSIDAETDGVPSPDADAATDEDGVADPIVVTVGEETVVTVSATNDTGEAATLAGWIDLDGNGTFDAGELLTAPVPANSGTAEYQLTFPVGTTTEDTYARFRLFAADVTEFLPTGAVAAGEVEDYAVSVIERNLDIAKTSTLTPESRAGDTVTYTVTARNTGTAPYTDSDPAVVFDDLSGVLDDAAYGGDAAAVASDGSEIPEPAFLEPSHVSWSGPLAAGETVTITYTVTLNGDGDGVTRNVAWVPTTPPPPGEVPPTPACDPADADGNDPVTGEPCAVVESDLPRLSVDKISDVADLPADGGVVTYQVTVTNEGPGVYTEDAPATVTDDLSGVLDDATFNEITAPESGAVFDEDAQELTWSGPLGAGESVTIEYSVTYDENAGDNALLNVACIPAGEAAPGAEACVDVRIPAAELDITKTADPADGTTVAAGQEVTYTISFASVGQIPAVVDSIDDLSDVFDDATLVDGSLSTSNDALTATLDGDQLALTGEVPNGETYTVSYTVVVNAYADQDNHRLGNVVTRPDGTCGSEECPTTEHPVRHLSLEKTATPTQDVLPGDVVEYTVTVTNDGAGDYTAEVPAVISDDMTDVIDDAAYNGDVAVVASDGSEAPVATFEGGILGWSGPLAAGESVTITYTVTVTNLGDHDLVNTVSPVCGEGEICDPPPPAVEILLPHVVPGKSSDPASGEDVVAGDVVTYTLSWTNDGQVTGPVDATDDLSRVLDDADLTGEPVVDEAHAESVEAVFDGEEQTIRVTGDIAPGETVTVTYQVTVKADGERGDNIAGNVLTPDVPPYVPAPDCEVDCEEFPPPTTEHRISEIVDSKSVNPESGTDVEPGQELTYTLTFENIGEATGTVDRVDDLTHVLDDADVTVAPAASDEALTVSEIVDGRFSITGELEPGQSVTVTYTVTVKAADQLGDATLGNFLLDPSTPPPAEPTCEEGAEDCTSNTIPNVIDSKSVNPESGTTVQPGQELTYTLTFQNIGSAAGAVDRVDDLSHVLDDADVTAQPAASDDALVVSEIEGNRFSIAGELAPGQTVTVVYTVTVKEPADMGDAQLANFLVDTDEEPPAQPEPDECEGSEDCTINPASKIVDSKSVDPASNTSITAGQELTYTLTFTNEGTAAGTVDRVDDLTHVLDDADVTAQPTASDPAVEVSAIEGNRFSVTGELQPGQTVTVTYTATVKAADALGDAQLANFLLDPQQQVPAEATCGDGEDCTFNPISDVTVTKTADPENGTAVKQGQEVSYTLTFVNDGEGAQAIDYTDHMDGVLDDADLTQAPTASDDALTASDVTDGSFSVSGELAGGQTVTVTYAVKVRDWDEQGDHSLGNVVTVTGQASPAQCADSELCTDHPVEEPQDPPLAATGSDIASIALLSALGLLVLGGGALLLIRRRQAAERGSDTP